MLFVYSLESGLLKNGLLDQQGRMQFGISYISSFLQKNGHRTDLVVIKFIMRTMLLINMSIKELRYIITYWKNILPNTTMRY